MSTQGETLSDKLKSLGVQLGAEHLKPRLPTRRPNPIEEVVEGVVIASSLGNTFVVQRDFDASYWHGCQVLCTQTDPAILAEWNRSHSLSRTPLNRFVFLDTETSGLAGGTGTFAFLIGLGFHTESGFRVVQLFMQDPSLEPALLNTLGSFINQFEAVVTYNGKAFDLPILKTRHILNGFDSPFESLQSVDLLHLTRRLWRNRLPSRALKDIEAWILDYGRTEEEVPGWMIPELYFDYLHTGDARPLSGVFYHNSTDILSLAALFNFINSMLSEPDLEKIPYGLDLIAIAKLYEDLGHYARAIKLYEEGLKAGLPEEFYVQTLMRFAQLYRRQSKWEEAVGLWQQASHYQSFEACVELAKFYEHRARDYTKAHTWALMALNCLPSKSSATVRALRQNVEYRLNRIAKKAA